MQNSSSHAFKPEITEIYSEKFSDFVDSFRIYEFKEESVLDLNPEGNFELIFQVNGNFSQRTYGSNEWNTRPSNFIGGLHSHSFQIRNEKAKSKIVSIRFKPLGARHFIQDRLNLFKNTLISIHDLNWRTDRMELEKGLTDGFVQRMDRLLDEQFSLCPKNSLDFAIESIKLSKGFIQIKDICHQLNISPSYLRKMFNEQIGTSPKEYTKVTRINYITHLLDSGTFSSLTELGYQLGYYDQSHFIKDFKSVTGRNPLSYRNSK